MTNPASPDSPAPDSPPPAWNSTPNGDPAAASPPPAGYPAQGAPSGYPAQGAPSGYPAQGAPSDYPAQGAPSDYPGEGAPAYGAPPTSPPGRVLSIIGLVLAFVVPPIGLILSIVAAVQLGKAKAPKGLAIAGIIVGAILTILAIIGIILFVTVIAGVISMCAQLGSGVWVVDGITYTCG